jgi:hypothetical protein
MAAGKPKTNVTKGIEKEAKARRRLEAEARNAEYQKLSPQQRLANLDKAGLKASKERAKIAKLL